MDGFVVPVIHHGGRLERKPNGEFEYVGGEVKKFKPMINFEDGLHELEGDMDINNMCEFTLNNNLKEFYIYIEHVVNVILHADENMVISSDSSSSSSSSSSNDGYETPEDEPYKPPPHGFESESSGGVSAN
ncbi:hypothetical protein PIB30_022907 [Stylosanthes scabra]|uniref:PB1-like domain-containing protein n=1 Tax=Stylosanthes scabra TaxID=79078 RepID=A0ABU6Z6S1_9FABA|nr:hypothetical protein [Stylosanthes scabra]